MISLKPADSFMYLREYQQNKEQGVHLEYFNLTIKMRCEVKFSKCKVLYATKKKKKNLKGEAPQTPQPDYQVHQEAPDQYHEKVTNINHTKFCRYLLLYFYMKIY